MGVEEGVWGIDLDLAVLLASSGNQNGLPHTMFTLFYDHDPFKITSNRYLKVSYVKPTEILEKN